ncbi:MAG: TlpA family protein disulfide reductase [Fibrobacterales bacterium]
MLKLLFILFMGALSSVQAVEIGDVLDDFSLKQSDGSTFEYSKKGEKPIMLVFWATWCTVCKKEIPQVQQLYNTYNTKGLQLLAINAGISDTEARMKTFKTTFSMEYPVAFDRGSSITQAMGVTATPTIVIADVTGVVRYVASELPHDLSTHFELLFKK